MGAAAELNRLDSYAGDGDFGITMTEAALAVEDVLSTTEQVGVAQLLSSCGAAIARRAPSTSGTLVATGLLAAAKVITGSPGADQTAETLERAFRAALESIQARGKAVVGDRTLVDGLDAVCQSLGQFAAARSDVGEALDAAARAASAAADATVNMTPRVGRASWVPERAAGHADAGCTMLAIVLTAAASFVKDRGHEGGHSEADGFFRH